MRDGIPGYDQWKTAEPDKDYYEQCLCCGADIAESDLDEFCSVSCADDHRAGKQLPCIRPMYELLCEVMRRPPDPKHAEGLFDKVLFRGTPAGVGFRFVDYNEIMITGIVEGTEFETSKNLIWPFTEERFWDAVQIVNDDCEEAYNDPDIRDQEEAE